MKKICSGDASWRAHDLVQRLLAALRCGSPGLSGAAHALRILGVALSVLVFAPAHAADTSDPYVAITSPTAGTVVRGLVTVTTRAGDNIGVSRVDLYANGRLVFQNYVAPFTFTWDSRRTPDGTVQLKSVVYDAANNHSNAIINVTVANGSTGTDTTAPTTSITSPAAGSVIKGTITVNASASDNVGVTRVDLYANERLMGSRTAAPYAFSWNSAQVADGSVVLKVVAFDAANNAASGMINATVNNATTAVSGPVLSVAAFNTGSTVSVRVHPADASGQGDGPASFTRTYAANARVWLSAPLRSGDKYFVKWQKNGVDYDTASTTSVVMDAALAMTAVYETPSCVGIPVYPGTDSLKSAVAGRPAGSTFCIKAGIHRMNSSVLARSGDRYIGEPGAILSGAKVVTSFSRSGSYWVATGQTQQEPPFPATVGGWGVCTPEAPSCIYPEMVFRNGQELTQVSSLAELGPGEFYFDYAANNIYLYDDPTGQTIEASTGSGGLIGNSDGASNNVLVKNLVFEKFGGGQVNLYAHNALKAVAGWRVENNEFRQISFIAVANFGNGLVRNNYIHRNGRYGIVGNGTFEGNVITHNNTHGWNTGTDAGSGKFHGTNGMVLKGNVVANNNSRGLWTDYDNINVTIENNIIENNLQMGILHEVSCAATIRNNVLRGNNYAYPGKAIWWGAQIFARSSKDMLIVGNDITAALPGVNAIGIYNGATGGTPQTYTGPICGVMQARNIMVRDNVVRLATGQQHGLAGSIGNYGSTYNIQFQNNTYYLKDLAGAYFQYNGGPVTKEQWRAQGQDVTGKFYQY